MIRAKTLLASVMVVGAAAVTFALNSSHHGFVPEDPNGKNSSSDLTIGEVRNTSPYAVVSQLPQLAPPPAKQTDAIDALDQTVVELAEASETPAASKQSVSVLATTGSGSDARELYDGTNTLAKVIPGTGQITALTDEPKLASKTTPKTTEFVMPLPTRAPDSAGLPDRSNFAAATPETRSGRTRGNRPLSLRTRKVKTKRLAVARKKVVAQKVSNLSGFKAKPVRHREPFDANRN